MQQNFITHTVENAPQPLENVNLLHSDTALCQALAHFGLSATQIAELHALGAELGTAERATLARQANQYPPRLQQYDRGGRRIDEVEFHPAWHALMQSLIAHGMHNLAWQDSAPPHAHLQRAAAYILFGQLENGSQCPTTMTFAAVPALAHAPQIARDWLPKILSREYDPRSLPLAQKKGVLIGMGMTEKQGGSDVRANTTIATPTGVEDAWGPRYQVLGHKWFFSAPQSDAHLILAQTEGVQSAGEARSSAGLTCFFLPRFLADGSRNSIHVQRLKDKLGNRSNASSEVEFCQAIAYPLGAIGRGIATIMEMGSLTRLDCVLGTAGIMRGALAHAIFHAQQRQVFGRTLVQQPLMQNVLADMALEAEAASLFALRLAHCFDAPHDPAEQALARLWTAAGKYWLCKRGPGFGAEAMEVLGGNGYVEDAPLARWYREFPVNSIWEGSGNVMCLDVLRVLAKGPAAQQALAKLLQSVAGQSAVLDAYAQDLLANLDQPQLESQARSLAMHIVLASQAALLLQAAPRSVAQAFIASRLPHGPAACYGSLPAGIDLAALLARALPENLQAEVV